MVQLAHPGVSPDVSPELIAKIPPIVDLDAHVVEPPDVWTTASARRSTATPDRTSSTAPPGTIVLDGAGYIEAPGTEGPDVAWWFYEDTLTSVKRLIAAVGLPARRDHAHRASPTTRCAPAAGRSRPPRRHGRQPRRGAAVLPQLPALLRPDLPVGQGQGARRALRRGVQRLDGRRVVRPERRSPPPAVPRAAVGRRARGRRGAAQRGARRARGRVHRDPRVPRAARASTPATGTRSSPRATETGTVICLHIGSGTKTLQTSADAPDAVPASLIFANSAASLVDFLFSGVLVRYPNLKLLYAEAQIGWIPYVLERADDVWITHRGGAAARSTARSRRPPTTTGRSTAASSRTRSASRCSTRSVARARLLRDRLPAPGQHLAALQARPRRRSSASSSQERGHAHRARHRDRTARIAVLA